MEIKLKQRLVGVLVLCALAVIFIPLLFHSSTTVPKQARLLTAIPPAPAKPSEQTVITLQEDGGAVATASSQPVTASAVPTSPSATTSKPAPPSAAVAAVEQTQLTAPHQVSIAANSDKPQQAAAASTPAKENVSSVSASAPTSEKKPAAAALASAGTKSSVQVKQQVATASVASTAKKAAATTKASTSLANTTQMRKTKVAAETQQMLAQEISRAAKTPAARATVSSGWVLQVGSFTDTKNATELEKQLRAKGLTVYTREIKLPKENKSAIKIFVGPAVKRSQIEAIQTKLAQEMHIKGIVQTFDPLQVKQPKAQTN